ncbi:MAG: hypothetical protein M0Q91_17290, partial [Methanoregula sp.]|nr:hypothetical protein [Methanoregula sp.]
MLKGLFLNSPKAQCSIHESGKMVYAALVLSDNYELDYLEIDPEHRTFPDIYDFLAFNYHPYTMAWLDTTSLRNIPVLKLNFILETLPNDPFPMCPATDFDIYCAIDPTIKCEDKRVYAFPRPLEPPFTGTYKESEIPVIGTFGFATAGKGFEYVVAAVNKEFDRAIIRINIPMGSYITARKTILPQKPTYADSLVERCQNLAKDGVELQVTHDYMTKRQLIEWCSENTLNVFLYNRNQPGLSATTDQAISSGRPLAVSGNETFRHILQYLKPYPERSLQESIEVSIPEIMHMQKDWEPIQFARLFEKVLEENPPKIRVKNLGEITIGKKNIVNAFWFRNKQRLSFFLNPVDEHIPEITFKGKNVLMISQKERKCGIYQYGRNITNSLKRSTNYNLIFCECGNRQDLDTAIQFYKPVAVIYNYYQPTMPWITRRVTRKYKIPHLAIIHEFVQEDADATNNKIFDYSLYQDPDLIERNPYVFRTKQLIYPYLNTKPLPAIPTIGSFGFGFADKGFEKLCSTVQEEFDEARINIHMACNDVVDPDCKNAYQTAVRCKNIIKKPGIRLNVTHNF